MTGIRNGSDWMRAGQAAGGIQALSAWFAGAAFARHRHDTYAIGVTDSGVQSFRYRGAMHSSMPGQVVVLHPDEPHDGFAGSKEGFGYRIIYVDPARIAEASGTLPFARRPVLTNARLAAAVAAAFDGDLEPLAIDAIILAVADALLEEGAGRAPAVRLDLIALEKARSFLDAAGNRIVRSAELEAVSGLSRFDLARQFRTWLGTSPYRYSLMRRLEFARVRLADEGPMVGVALEAGFSDQAHFTRLFRTAFGITPARYRALNS